MPAIPHQNTRRLVVQDPPSSDTPRDGGLRKKPHMIAVPIGGMVWRRGVQERSPLPPSGAAPPSPPHPRGAPLFLRSMYLRNVVVNIHKKSTEDNLFLHTRATIAHVVVSVYIDIVRGASLGGHVSSNEPLCKYLNYSQPSRDSIAPPFMIFCVMNNMGN